LHTQHLLHTQSLFNSINSKLRIFLYVVVSHSPETSTCILGASCLMLIVPAQPFQHNTISSGTCTYKCLHFPLTYFKGVLSVYCASYILNSLSAHQHRMYKFGLTVEIYFQDS